MNTFGQSIKAWRKSRGLSQLHLSLDANVSSRHISFLETGKSRPSEAMVIHLSEILDIPLHERNRLLTQSGFAEIYSHCNLDQQAMKPVKQALTLIIENHNPYPAVVFDWDWNIIMKNASFQWIHTQIKSLQLDFPDHNNIIELLFDPKGYKPFVDNWDQVTQLLLTRIYRERSLRKDRHSGLLERLSVLDGVNINNDKWINNIPTTLTEPMINLVISIGDFSLKLFSTLASFGTASDITMQELVIEHYFPADDFSKEFFNSLEF